MTSSTKPLPEYRNPPVVEVVLAIQFKSPIGYRALDLARFEQAWIADFPHVEEKAMLPMMRIHHEEVDVMLEVFDQIPTPRLWFQNSDGDRVLQIQQDRIVVNWRRGSPDKPYPRFVSIRETFADAWSKLIETVQFAGFEPPQPAICEVQYINRIDEQHGWRSTLDTASLIAPWQGTMSDNFLPSNFPSSQKLIFPFTDRQGELLIHGWIPFPQQDILMLHLQARGEATAPTIDGALQFMDFAHEWIVRGFTSVTTPEAHKLWGRTI